MKSLAKALILILLYACFPYIINAQQQDKVIEPKTVKCGFLPGDVKYTGNPSTGAEVLKLLYSFANPQHTIVSKRLKRIKNYYKLSLNYNTGSTESCVSTFIKMVFFIG
ncbi:MAG TPA: hypothetical protein VG738_22210 [Chitinophagaceae bacterium]|nr:hypothetical protein [Chitinophagaceae bacterium]